MRYFNGRYKLMGHRAVPVEDLMEWANWMEKADRRVALTQISEKCKVSTVFLGLDHNILGDRPRLFETMVFGGKMDGEQWRYETWKEAESGHRKIVNKLTTKLKAVKAS